MSLSHRQAREYLQAVADGLLGVAERTELQHHLEGCSQCRAYAADLERLEAALARSLQARWPRARLNDPKLRRSMAKVQDRLGRKHWLQRIYDLAQAVAWAGLTVALFIAVVWLFRTVTPQLATTPIKSPTPVPTATPVPTLTREAIVELVTPTAETTREQMHALTICMGSEPDTLYLYGGGLLATRHVHEAIYDGPIDNRNFGYQPVILEKLPSLADGDAVTETVKVQAGDRVIDNAGQPVVLAEGVLVRPVGCYSAECATAFDGTPLDMERLVVTFRLLTGIRWSDGEPLTAYDSVYSFELDGDPDTPTDKYLILRTARYEALDDYTTVWSGLPGYRDAQYLTHFWTPLPAHLWGTLTALELTQAQESTREPVGWGPYVIKEWIPGDHIMLVKNERYWRADEGLPKFETVFYRFVGENASANVAALLSGECDIVEQSANLESQSEMLLELQAVGKLNATFVTGTAWEHADFAINPAESYQRPDLFGDVRVRRAIAHCTDRQAIVDGVLFGQSQVLDSYLPAEHPLYNPAVRQYPFDPQAGSALLEAAGWIDEDGDSATPRVAQGVPGVPDGTMLAFSFWTTTATQRQVTGQILQASLAQCGIKVELEYWSPSELFADGPDGPLFGRHFDMAQFAWLTAVEPSCELYLCSQIPSEENQWSGSNSTGFCDAAYDAACTAARQSLPGTPRYIKFHQEAQRIFSEHLPVVPLYQRIKLAATRPNMQGFIMDPTAQSEFWNIEAFDHGE